jgi:hypothetical protein
MGNRIRRIKCDEQKPHCFKCTSTGRKCDGYQFKSLPGQPGRLVHNISLILPGTPKERRAFEFFRTCTAPELCGYFPEEFWQRNILLKMLRAARMACESSACWIMGAGEVGSIRDVHPATLI